MIGLLDSLALTFPSAAATATCGDRATVADCGKCTANSWKPTDRMRRRCDGTALRNTALEGAASRAARGDAIAELRGADARDARQADEGHQDKRGPAQAADAADGLRCGTTMTEAGTRTKPTCREMLRVVVAFRTSEPFGCLANAHDQLRAGLARRVRKHAA